MQKKPKPPKPPPQEAKPTSLPARPPRSRDRSKSPNEWSCPKCTLKNEITAAKCVACDADRPAVAAKSPPSVNGHSAIKCPACTFENRPSHTICEMCGTVLKTKGRRERGSGDVTPSATAVTADPLSNSLRSRSGMLIRQRASQQQSNDSSRPDSVASLAPMKHESELMDQLREVEEREARDKWKNILAFCKEVREDEVRVF